MGDCDAGNKGTFGWVAGGTTTLDSALLWCSKQCDSCKRCKFISLSLEYKDCSWYNECNLERLEPPPNQDSYSIRSGLALPADLVKDVPLGGVRWQSPGPPTQRRNLSRLLPAAGVQTPPWFQPHQTMSMAVILFGKIGTLSASGSALQPDLSPNLSPNKPRRRKPGGQQKEPPTGRGASGRGGGSAGRGGRRGGGRSHSRGNPQRNGASSRANEPVAVDAREQHPPDSDGRRLREQTAEADEPSAAFTPAKPMSAARLQSLRWAQSQGRRTRAKGSGGAKGSGAKGRGGRGAVGKATTPEQIRAEQRMMVREAHRSFRVHVLEPNPHVAVDCFAHSWAPSLGPLIDEVYQPIASEHEPERTMKDFRGLPQLSAFASIRRALSLKQTHERTRQRPYDFAMVLRYDVAWHAPVRWEHFPRAQVWAVAQCCGWQPSPVGPGSSLTKRSSTESLMMARAVERQCLGPAMGEVMDYCRVSRYQLSAANTLPTLQAELNFNLNDWALFAPSSTLDTLEHVLLNFDAYSGALSELGILPKYMHFLFAAHIHIALGVGDGLRGAPVHVSMLRNALSARCFSGGSSLEQLLPPPREPISLGMRHVCAWRGAVRCYAHSLRCAMQRDSLVPPGVNYSHPPLGNPAPANNGHGGGDGWSGGSEVAATATDVVRGAKGGGSGRGRGRGRGGGAGRGAGGGSRRAEAAARLPGALRTRAAPA